MFGVIPISLPVEIFLYLNGLYMYSVFYQGSIFVYTLFNLVFYFMEKSFFSSVKPIYRNIYIALVLDRNLLVLLILGLYLGNTDGYYHSLYMLYIITWISEYIQFKDILRMYPTIQKIILVSLEIAKLLLLLSLINHVISRLLEKINGYVLNTSGYSGRGVNPHNNNPNNPNQPPEPNPNNGNNSLHSTSSDEHDRKYYDQFYRVRGREWTSINGYTTESVYYKGTDLRVKKIYYKVVFKDGRQYYKIIKADKYVNGVFVKTKWYEE